MAEENKLGREALEQLLKSLNMDSVIKGSEIAATIPEDKRTFAQREDVAEFMRYKSLTEEQDNLTEAADKKAMGGMMYATGSLVGNQSELDKNKDGEITSQDFAMLRQGKQEGGSLMVPPEMEGMMADDMPVDTYPNIPPEEMDEAMASQLPDAEMEDKYLDHKKEIEKINLRVKEYL